MATKNGVCPHCQFSRLERRIFPVNPEASTVYCPFCMRELNPTEAINSYNEIINGMLEKADSSLLVACDPVLAYRQYAGVLEVEPNNSRALLGRILCLIYTSKIKRSYLVEANDLLGEITYKGTDEVTRYVGFLKRINFALDEYDMALNKKLTHHGQYYDEECLKMYLKRLNEIINFKRDILDTLNKIKKDYVSQKNEVLINLISHNISEKENSLRTSKFLITGIGYKVTRVGADKISITETGETVNTHYNKKGLYTLNENDKSKKLIKDTVFKDYTPIIRAKNISIYFAILCILIAVGCGAAAYVFFKDALLFPIFVIAAGLAFAGFITLLILHLSWRSILKKRKLRID